MSEPLTGTATWRPVMQAAGFRCQCTGACGNLHAKSEGRCPHQHDAYAGKHGHRVRLIAAPADPLTTAVAAAALPASELLAWCPACHTADGRAARRAAAPVAVEAPGLFEL
ncbi:hypothetical protein N4G70_00405 [Streptomyces sp. ASQP_92]|uniref:hypothetical protein n=1 Tax=Streptomyces sp. ASQP_92 TaxID=2979116 RepID=UPI0021BFAF6A|nr:hypothetical protein [Streptomyces sp. ASQP_92]MCT9087326.1 hypothetical protein [Streptomyces sp. ASQP_92]